MPAGDYPRVLVHQAFYDRSAKRLAIGLLPGEGQRGPTTFAISGLDPRSRYEVLVDGRPHGDVNARIEWRDDRLHLTTELRRATSIRVTETSRAA